MIFYEKSKDPQNNQGLVKINDEKFLAKLKSEFNSNFNIYKNDLSPLICGTIVNKTVGSSPFSRKLKMIKTGIFSLL